VASALPAAIDLADPLPAAIRQELGLVELPVAIAHIHFPKDDETLQAARHRLVFDEFFYLQLGLLRRRQERDGKQATSVILPPTGDPDRSVLRKLALWLYRGPTAGGERNFDRSAAIHPMNRLVQGDVGSGKTVVAVVAILAAIQAGYQAALMAPTEVLAEQHYRKLVELVQCAAFARRVADRLHPHRQTPQLLGELSTGELPLLVGTHALIEDPVQFQRLGLVAIDEQHRFGVQQRARLQRKGDNPHVLTLTATPIPRTLALTLHGDLDVSQIDELPPGRKAIQTTLLRGAIAPTPMT
jgi:ATP-dependent DNA helicase RecG